MPLQLFRSTDANAPTLTGQAGSMTGLLDACLVDGYTTASVSGITRSGSTATATLAVANTTLRTGDYLKFAGADQADYNVTAQIAVVNSTTVTYSVSNSPATPATGTITYRKAAAGWDTAFTGTNKRVYRSPNSASNRFYLRIDDSTAVGNVREAYARAYEAMTDVDTGTGPFPTAAQVTNGLTWNKSITADSTTRTWTLVGDDKTFYLFVAPGIPTYGTILLFGFGHLPSYKASDGFNTFVAGANISNYTTASGVSTGYSGLQIASAWGATAPVGSVPLYLARSYAQTGSSVAASVHDGKVASGSPIGAASAGIVYPNGPDSGLWVSPVFVSDFAGSVHNARGRLPGMYGHLHSTIPQSNGDFVTGVVGLSGITLLATSHSINTSSNVVTSGMFHVDITGPW